MDLLICNRCIRTGGKTSCNGKRPCNLCIGPMTSLDCDDPTEEARRQCGGDCRVYPHNPLFSTSICDRCKRNEHGANCDKFLTGRNNCAAAGVKCKYTGQVASNVKTAPE